MAGRAIAVAAAVLAIVVVGERLTHPAPLAAAGPAKSDDQATPSGETMVQFAEDARNDNRFMPGSGKHDFEATSAVQKAVTRSFGSEPDYDAQVRFLAPGDEACWSGQGPSHEFFVYKKDGAISTGVVCEDAKEDWYVTHLRLLKEGTGERYPGD